jgi:hypothetical protein
VEEEPVTPVEEAAVVEAAPALPDTMEVDVVVAAPALDSPPAGEETLAVEAAMPDLPVQNIPAVEEALAIEERCPSPCPEASCPVAAEEVAPHVPDEPVKVPAPKQKKKPRSSRKNAVETTPLEPQPTSPPAAPTKSYSAVCRSGAEVPAAPPPARPASPQEVRVAAPPADQWENLPASLSASPERWQRKRDRKRKSKKSNLESSEEDRSEELPEPAVTETREEEEVVVMPAPPKESTPEAAGAGQEEPAVRDEVEGEGEETRRSNKSVKRRRRKHTSEEPEEGHRVIICDNQVRFFSALQFY